MGRGSLKGYVLKANAPKFIEGNPPHGHHQPHFGKGNTQKEGRRSENESGGGGPPKIDRRVGAAASRPDHPPTPIWSCRQQLRRSDDDTTLSFTGCVVAVGLDDGKVGERRSAWGKEVSAAAATQLGFIVVVVDRRLSQTWPQPIHCRLKAIQQMNIQPIPFSPFGSGPLLPRFVQ